MTMSMSKLYRRYKPRIIKLLNEICTSLNEEGYDCDEPYEMSDDEYKWMISPSDQSFDVSITILESKARDGEDDFGVNFSLDMVEWEGIIIGMLTPYNYSDRVWVSRKDPDEVEERWKEFANAIDPGEILACIQRHYTTTKQEAES